MITSATMKILMLIQKPFHMSLMWPSGKCQSNRTARTCPSLEPKNQKRKARIRAVRPKPTTYQMAMRESSAATRASAS